MFYETRTFSALLHFKRYATSLRRETSAFAYLYALAHHSGTSRNNHSKHFPQKQFTNHCQGCDFSSAQRQLFSFSYYDAARLFNRCISFSFVFSFYFFIFYYFRHSAASSTGRPMSCTDYAQSTLVAFSSRADTTENGESRNS